MTEREAGFCNCVAHGVCGFRPDRTDRDTTSTPPHMSVNVLFPDDGPSYLTVVQKAIKTSTIPRRRSFSILI
jgi:hypothetical protein